MNAEPISAETFNRFRALARTAADIATTQPNPSLQVSWFVGCVNDMDIDQFSSDHMDAFFQRFPDQESITQPGVDENARAVNACRKLEYIVTDWTYISPNIRGLITTFEAGRVAGQRAAQAEPTTQPGAAVTPTEGTAGTAGVTGPARPSIIFEYIFPHNDNQVSALEKYINLGHQIKFGPGYENSALWNLEKFLRHGRPEVERHLGNAHFMIANDPLQRTFYAIAAPSLEGKTQSAFVFREVKPLYFVATTQMANMQPIYRNFIGLSSQLVEFARMDLELIRQVNISTGLENNLDLEHISANMLYGSHIYQKFYVLGFIKALILDARANYRDTNNTSWMEYYVRTNRRLEVTPTSIAEFHLLGENIIVKEFVLFLDEFTGNRSDLKNVLIRNLGRAANFKVLVSNTNTKVTNLVGANQAVHSRGEISAWAVVFTKLNSLNPLTVPSLANLKNELYDKVEPPELSDLEAFFENFETVQVYKLRPGFVFLIVDAMTRFNQWVTDRLFSLNEFISFVVNDLGFELKKRKTDLVRTNAGLIGTKALYFSNAYGSTLDEDVNLISHCKQYLDSHFYYLLNPVDPSKFCFITYPPGSSSRNEDATGTQVDMDTTGTQVDMDTTGTEEDMDTTEQVVEPPAVEGDPYLDIFLRGSIDREWTPELTIFEKNETLPFLAFLEIWHDRSIPNILRRANEISDVRESLNMPNPILAVPRSGNSLEVLSSVCSINASHRDLNSEKMTFTGQSCKDFLANLIKNLISADHCRIRSDYQVVFPLMRHAHIFNRIHVPFLFPSNISIPEDFWSRFTNADQFLDLPFHVGMFERTTNGAEIDAKFDLFLKDVSRPGDVSRPRYTKGVSTIECKNLGENINFGTLKNIFCKAQNNGASLSILICNKIVGSSEEANLTLLKNESIAQNWEVFKIVKSRSPIGNGRIFTVQRLHPEIRLRIDKDCKMVCVILELDVINAML